MLKFGNLKLWSRSVRCAELVSLARPDCVLRIQCLCKSSREDGSVSKLPLCVQKAGYADEQSVDEMLKEILKLSRENSKKHDRASANALFYCAGTSVFAFIYFLVPKWDEHFKSQSVSVFSKVFYSKMKGDYLRYLSEVSSGDARQEAVNKSCAAYDEAFALAKKEMSPAHPIRLALALESAFFYKEINNCSDRACRLAREAINDAVFDADNIDDSLKQDSSLILQILQNALKIWNVMDSKKNRKEKKWWRCW